jgi:molybdate transport system permease protein
VNWAAFELTARLALVTTAILFLLGMPLAYWIAFSRWRWKFLVESIVAMPLVLPPTVLGFYVLIGIGSQSPIGRWFESLVGHSFAFSFEGLVVGSVLYSLPFMVQPVAAAFASVDPQLLRAAELLGAGRWRSVRRVLFPLSRSGIVTGIVLAFAHTVGEFGVVLMVGGNIPGITRTVSIDIYDRVQGLDYAAANQTSLVLLLFSFVVLAAVYGSNRMAVSDWMSK